MLRKRKDGEKTGTCASGKIKSWMLLHFDSHPDLACPSPDIPAAACFTPRKSFRHAHDMNSCEGGEKSLYEMLDTSKSGIAEWIMPLSLAGGLGSIHWIKNKWCDQFDVGEYGFCVGASVFDREREPNGVTDIDNNITPATFLDLPENACVKSSLCHPYYLDDNSVVPIDELMLKQDVELFVSELGEDTSSEKFAQFMANAQRSKGAVDDSSRNEAEFWVLDICLDYFSCTNPFISELEGIDKNITMLLLDAVQETRFKKLGDADHHYDGTNSIYETELSAFRQCVNTVLDELVSKLSGDTSISCVSDNLLSTNETLFNLYCQPDVGKRIWNRLVTSLISWACKERKKIDYFINIIKNAMPNLALPHTEYIEDDSSWNNIEEQVTLFGKSLLQLNYPAPNMVTISRSSEDGFTPMRIVEALQNAVLREVQSVYCNCEHYCSSMSNDCCKEGHYREHNFNIILDYGEYEGSSFERAI